jgi:hypothetical protein
MSTTRHNLTSLVGTKTTCYNQHACWFVHVHVCIVGMSRWGQHIVAVEMCPPNGKSEKEYMTQCNYMRHEHRIQLITWSTQLTTERDPHDCPATAPWLQYDCTDLATCTTARLTRLHVTTHTSRHANYCLLVLLNLLCNHHRSAWRVPAVDWNQSLLGDKHCASPTLRVGVRATIASNYCYDLKMTVKSCLIFDNTQ